MSRPAISVIMATYNGSAFIDETIASLLNQSCHDFELVAVDDCSTDNTVARLRGHNDPRIRVLSTSSNAGPVAARNLAMSVAQGHYFAALDQDDISHPDRLAKQMAYLDANPKVILVGTAARRLNGGRYTRDGFPARTSPELIRWMLHVRNPFVWSSVMMRADAVHKLGVFSRFEREFAEDFDLYHRLASFGNLARLDEVLTTYRCHSQGASQTRREIMTTNAALVLKDAYDALGCLESGTTADLITRHVAGREAVSDYACLKALGHHLETVTRHVAARYDTDAVTTRLIGAERTRLMGQLSRSFARSLIRGSMSSSFGMRKLTANDQKYDPPSGLSQ